MGETFLYHGSAGIIKARFMEKGMVLMIMAAGFTAPGIKNLQRNGHVPEIRQRL